MMNPVSETGFEIIDWEAYDFSITVMARKSGDDARRKLEKGLSGSDYYRYPKCPVVLMVSADSPHQKKGYPEHSKMPYHLKWL